MSLNLGTILAATAGNDPSRRAMRFNARDFTYGEVDRAARGLATALRERGIAPGSNVSILIPNLPEFSIAYFGILYAGCTVVPLNVLLTGPEVAYHLEDAEAKLLIAHRLFDDAARAGAAAAGIPVVWAGDGAATGETLADLTQAAAAECPHPTSADDTAVILYTSGTTGKPKGAELTHANLFLNCAVVTPHLIAFGPDDVALATLPLFHSFGQTCVQNTSLHLGASFTLLPRFTPEEALAIIQRDRVTIFAGVPAMYYGILHYPEAHRYDLSSLRFCLTGGAPMPVEVLKAFEERYGVPVLEGYGLSETSPVASFNLPDRPRRAGTIGWPVWGVELAILDENDRSLPDGETGEIGIRGHNVMKGYWRRPEATAECMRNGWFHTGDVGVREANGCYRIVDRKKDMIIRGGFNVYPREIEEVLFAHPEILEAAVIGVPHERHGEEVKAIVVRRPGTALVESAVIQYCKERLAAYKYPRIIEFRDALPKGPTGKILKRELR
jgi:long-chain acyl-CoA synthetase